MFGQSFVGWFDKRSQLHRPDGLLDCLESLFVRFAAPECVDDVFEANNARLAQELLNYDVVRDCKSL